MYSHWNDGSTASRYPRILHAEDDIVLLVSSVYICPQGHRTLGHDSTILKQLPSYTEIPFVLLHKSGFTANFVAACSSMCNNGFAILKIESILAERRWGYYTRRKEMYSAAVKSYKCQQSDFEMEAFPDFSEIGLPHLPSNDIIAHIFLHDFFENERRYIHSVQQLLCEQFLSIDHTFKVATNIGYVRSDGKWTTLFDGLLLVMNEKGQVISWQFTNSTAFDNVADLLSQLARRFQNANKSINIISVDNCCQWRKKLQNVFGDNVRVVLDLFHAVQRISRKIPKRHPYYHSCIQDLRLAFRQKGDYGLKRTLDTPSSKTITENLNDFANKWRKIDKNGWKIFTKEAQHEVQKLITHASKKCITEIPKGCGTNHNEAFHRHLNSILSKNRIGVMLAYALITVAIYSHNNNIGKKGKRIVKSIQEYSVCSSETLEHMGFPNSSLRKEIDQESGATMESSPLDTTEEILSAETAFKIANKSVMLFEMNRNMSAHTQTSGKKWLYIPFMHNIHGLPCNTHSTSDWTHHEENIDTVLLAWNFERVRVEADGDCFFQGIALNLLNRKEIWNIRDDSNMEQVVAILRQALVEEWTGDSIDEYIGFIRCHNQSTDQDKDSQFEQRTEVFQTEANKFLLPGFYDTDIGDAMPLGIYVQCSQTTNNNFHI